MANKTLTLFFLILTSSLFCQSSGLYLSKRDNLEIELINESVIKFRYFNLGEMDSVEANYFVKDRIMNIKFSLYEFDFIQVDCKDENYGILINDDMHCFTKGVGVNNDFFLTNFVPFNLLSLKENQDTITLTNNKCNEVQFKEQVTVNKLNCYYLFVRFNPKPFDTERFSKIYIKNNNSIVVDGVKYSRCRSRR